MSESEIPSGHGVLERVFVEVEQLRSIIRAALAPSGSNRFEWMGAQLWLDRARLLAIDLEYVRDRPCPPFDQAKQASCLACDRCFGRSRRGALVNQNYGRADFATAAGLAPLGTQGLQPVGEREALPVVVARFLAAAEQGLSTSSAGR